MSDAAVITGTENPADPTVELRVLVLAPSANDAPLTCRFLADAGMECRNCTDVAALVEALRQGCGSILIAEEVLASREVLNLVDALGEQPAWSDVPITIITSGGEANQTRLRRLEVFGPGGNVGLLERPFRPETLVSAVEVALRARRRQYETRNLLRKLEAGEERLRGILESISDAFISFDRDWRITYVNPAYLQLVAPLYGSADDLLGAVLWDKFPDIVDTEVGRFYKRAMEEQEAGSFEVFYAPLHAWFDIRAFPSARGLSLYVQDISLRKAHESEVAELHAQLQEQARVFDTTLSNISDFAYTFDRDGRFIYVNKPLLDLWGLSLEEAVGKNFFDLGYEPELAARLQRQISEVFETRKTLVDETPYTSPSGVTGYYEYILSPVIEADGSVSIVAGSTRSITERKKQEAQLAKLAADIEAQARLFDATLSSIADLAYTFDTSGRVIYANKPLLEIWGRSLEEVKGKNLFELDYPEALARRLTDELLQVVETGKAVMGDVEFTSATGITDHHEYIYNPVFDPAGRVVAVAGTTRIVTERKRAETAMQEAKDAAEAANRSKDHFLAVLSHELRTPLTPVLMTASVLEMDPKLPPDLRADMAMIRRNVELETKLIDDLLDLSRITAGKLSLRLQAIHLNEAVRHVVDTCRQQIQQKGVDLRIDLAKEEGCVRADPARLQQILWNILKNAAKFTPAGGRIDVVTNRKGPDRFEVMVRDTGVGIDREVLPRIFDAFEQGNARVTREFGGLGLGLAITKALVELHSGSIRAESDGPRSGSAFFVELPVAVMEDEAPDAQDDGGRHGGALRILVVEDHADTAYMLRKLLDAAGHRVTVATSATDALEIAKRQTFDLLVSDIGLPDLPGYELMRQLKDRGKIKGIAMSGYGMEEDIRRSFEAGFSEHLVKPLDFPVLERAIRRLAQGL